jgi:GNAT superfamily N-acetyltransferase
MQRAGELLFLVSNLAGDETKPPPDLEFEPYRASQRDRLAAVIGRTYHASLDLPLLDGVRSLDDVIEGHQRTGVHRPEFWFFVRRGGCDVGCLLLTEHPPHRQWELVYMGVTPEARGQGMGQAIARQAQQLVRRAGGCELFLAVDAANAPACKIYAQAGFRPWRRAAVYLKVLGAAVDSTPS